MPQGSVFSLLILLIWAGLGLTCIGIGSLLRRLCKAPIRQVDGLFVSFWLGWIGVMFGLQIWHLFFKIDLGALVLTGVVGAIGIGVIGVSGYRPWQCLARRMPERLPLVALLVLAAIWLSNRALGGPRNGDSGMYYIPTVHWLLEYPIVPGLGNLYSGLGDNQSYFLYVALLEVGPLTHWSWHLANGLLVLALSIRVLVGLYRLLRRSWSCTLADTFFALSLPAVVPLVFHPNFTSPAPDLAVFVLGVVVSGELMAFLSRREPKPAPDFDVLTIGLLAAAGVTVKLSFAGLALGVFVVTIAVWLWRDRPDRRGRRATLIALALLLGGYLIPWMVRSVILTGYPLYPSAVGAMPVDWRVLPGVAEHIRKVNSIPGPLWMVFRDPGWFGRCLDALGWYDRDVLLPVAIILCSTTAGLARHVFRGPQPRSRQRIAALVLLPAMISFAFTFGAAPRPRFAGAALWIIAVTGVLLVLGLALLERGSRVRIAAGVGAVLLAILPIFDGQPVWSTLRRFEPLPRPQVERLRLETGLVVNYSGPGLCCWEAPLPCTPRPNPALRLRRPGDLAAGFMLDETVLQRHHR